jgi:hypothetical protein
LVSAALADEKQMTLIHAPSAVMPEVAPSQPIAVGCSRSTPA